MNMKVEQMQLEYAEEISNWIYDESYSLYSMDGSWDIIEEIMGENYYSVFCEEELIGYFCFGESARVPSGIMQGFYDTPDTMDIGLGLRPDLTGKGIGLEFILKGVEFGFNKYRPIMARLTVAEFNKRAIRVYEKAGFVKEGSFINKRNEEEREFIVMTKVL